MNILIDLAQKADRDYITPEDVRQALIQGTDPTVVRLDVLEVLGKSTSFGWEDYSLCAHIAWRGTPARVPKTQST